MLADYIALVCIGSMFLVCSSFCMWMDGELVRADNSIASHYEDLIALQYERGKQKLQKG